VSHLISFGSFESRFFPQKFKFCSEGVGASGGAQTVILSLFKIGILLFRALFWVRSRRSLGRNPGPAFLMDQYQQVWRGT
jgi:hypothetical protein